MLPNGTTPLSAVPACIEGRPCSLADVNDRKDDEENVVDNAVEISGVRKSSLAGGDG